MRLLRAFWLTATTVLAVAAATAVAVVFAGDANAATVRQTYLQFNMCGNACNHGGSTVERNLERTIGADTPFLVTLNEVCESQYQQLRSALRAYGGRFDPTGPTCDNGSRYGNAILARVSEVDLVGSWGLPNPSGGEPRRLMCLRVQPTGGIGLVVCVTHISPVPADIGAQVDAVAGVVHGLGGAQAVVLGGDFNTDPADTRLNPLYSTCYRSGTGTFAEADSAECGSRATNETRRGVDVANDHTFGRHKLDYIFLSDGHWSTARASAFDAVSGLSDHAALRATATLRG
jgi:endonuclease/exonuclease/phosphatase family metal-dependent hydrolase